MKSAILKHFQTVDPVIYPIVSQVNRTLLPNQNEAVYFQALCQNIIGQQLSGKVADVIIARFEALLPTGITPETVGRLSPEKLRSVGMSNAKTSYVLDLAAKVGSGEVNLTGLSRLDNQQIITELIKVKGIGNWTAEMFLIFTLGREDVFSFGDLGLKNAFYQLYQTKNLEIMKQITRRWAPYRSYGSLALWHSLAK